MSKDKAFRDCLLNTCIRWSRHLFENLTLTNCLRNKEFVGLCKELLNDSFFKTPIEPAMGRGYNLLIKQLSKI